LRHNKLRVKWNLADWIVVITSVILIILFMLFPIGSNSVDASSPDSNRFEVVQGTVYGVNERDTYLVVDTITRVQYLYLVGRQSVSMTALLGSDGKPILFEGDITKYENADHSFDWFF